MSKELDFYAGEVTRGRMTRREFMGKAAALGVAAATASTMFADAARASGPVKGGSFKMGVQGGESTNSQDPALWASDVPIAGGRCWGETLTEVGPDGTVQGFVAESWEGSADAKTWRFKIRDGIEFSNGKSVTAEDVMRTMERHTNEDSQSGALGIVNGIESMRVDGDVFELTLGVGNADMPYLISDYHLVIQPNGGFDNPTAAISTGPYTLESDEPGVRMTFKRNPNYWGGDSVAYYDEVEVLTLNDATARTAALQSGQVDSINRVEPKIADLLGRAP
ncbi:MAG: twin-arginine translocation signal domain-containing protein, partial [Rhodobacteraceae bacterium]|nr:twin-arginine translocation signal domain-containing protein [Paracoccaceae bacterium]